MSADAKKYHAYARECLQFAEQADSVETREKLLELSLVWMEAALREEGVLKPESNRAHKSYAFVASSVAPPRRRAWRLGPRGRRWDTVAGTGDVN
jgi:hypothetical protein